MSTNTKVFKVGLVGCGNIAGVHMRYILEQIPKENIAVCDFCEAKARIFAQRYDIKDHFSSVEAMLRDFRPDVCHILTPPHTHAETAVKCLENGSNVFIEKPMTTTLPDADKIISTCRKMNKLACINHQYVVHRSVLRAKRILESGVLGSVVAMNAFWGGNYSQQLKEGVYVRWGSEMPGGIFFDWLPHILSVFDVFVGGFDVRDAYYVHNENGQVTDLFAECLSAEGGVQVGLHISLRSRTQNQIRIICSNGEINIDLRNYTIYVGKRRKLPEFINRWWENLATACQLVKETAANVCLIAAGKLKSYIGTGVMISRFYKAVSGKATSPFSPQMGKRIVEKALDIVNAAEKGKKPSLTVFKQTVVPGASGAKILVTGGTGFIGSHLVSRLAQNGRKVKVLSRCLNQNGLRFPDNVEIFPGDVCDARSVEDAMDGVEIVYHLAAGMKGDWSQVFDTTVLGTENVIRAADRHGIKKLVHVSSVGVYERASCSNGSVLSEEHPYEKKPELRGYYSASKIEAEKLLLKYMNNGGRLKGCIIRPGLVYGPGKVSIPTILSRAIYSGRTKILIAIDSKGRHLNYVYVENLVDAIIKAGEDDKANGLVFNVVDNQAVTLREYLRSYKRNTGESVQIICIPPKVFKFGVRAVELIFRREPSASYKLNCAVKDVIYNADRIKNTLGWQSRISWDEALKESLGKNVC